MKRRKFLQSGALATITASMATPSLVMGNTTNDKKVVGKAKNIIFLVSDGMSSGTLNMADLLMQRKFGKPGTWSQLYRDNLVRRALMDTASVGTLVTDSAAASSAWGGGVRVKNGSLNVNTDGSTNTPILQKFKAMGKSVGCVTTVPITHATPAGFSVCKKHRNMQDIIASEYMKLGFDVMMGGGKEYFDGRKREDKRNILGDFIKADFQVVHDKTAMNKTVAGKPILGIFYDDGLPFTLDQQSDSKLTKTIPTLAEMTKKSISLMKENDNGFVLQVEGGKVDWAAHANDASALLYDQMAFEEAVSVAVNFAKQRKDTLVIITTDHGNSNPGLIKHYNVDKMFDTMQTAKHTNEWILNGINKTDSISSIIERINFAQGITLKKEEAQKILEQYQSLENGGIYNPYKLPYKLLADIQKKYTSIYWSGTNHSADYVELAMFGAGSEALPAFVKNIDLHHYMLAAAGVQKQVSAS